jgi:GntR family transcriptional regulator, transcriptional repressor for pyruvate dehydrogenase complex
VKVHATPRELMNGSNDSRVVAPIKVARAYEQLAGVLRERISSNEMPEGARLPSETALAEQAGVSRSTVREALRMLEEAGLVERVSPRVMVVARRTDDRAFVELRRELRRHNVTFHHLYEALMTLDPELSGYAATRADASDVRALREFITAQERSFDDLMEWSRLDCDFHLAIAEMSANPALIIAREPINQLLLPTLYRFMDSREMAEHATRYHRRIVDEIEAHDPGTAVAVTRRHINDWRTAWEKHGFDFHEMVIDLSDLPADSAAKPD